MPAPNKGRRFPAEVLSTAECSALLGACGRGFAGVRNRALYALLWRSGLRISEALALRTVDVDLALGTVQIAHGKGDRRRVVGIDALAGGLVELWLHDRRWLGIRTQLLFTTISAPAPGRPLQSSCVRESLRLAAKKAGIAKRVHPHGLRHTHAAELAREGVPIHVIRRQLGHASLDTTARYVEHLEPLEVVRAIQARQIPNHLSDLPMLHGGPPIQASGAAAASADAAEP